jgi:hypothetical protein
MQGRNVDREELSRSLNVGKTKTPHENCYVDECLFRFVANRLSCYGATWLGRGSGGIMLSISRAPGYLVQLVVYQRWS